MTQGKRWKRGKKEKEGKRERRGEEKDKEGGGKRNVDELRPNELTTLWLVLCTFVACFQANQMRVCVCEACKCAGCYKHKYLTFVSGGLRFGQSGWLHPFRFRLRLSASAFRFQQICGNDMQLIGVFNAQSEQINGTLQRHAVAHCACRCVGVCVRWVLSVAKRLLQNLK